MPLRPPAPAGAPSKPPESPGGIAKLRLGGRWPGRIAALLLALAPAPARAESPTELAIELVAAYVYKFAGFVEWPPEAMAVESAPLVIGVLGDDELANELVTIYANRNAKGRKFQVRKLHVGEPLQDLHMLYLGKLNRAQLNDALAAVRSRPVLTISETEEEFALGSMINLVVVVDDHIRFDVALKPATAGRLKISSLMLGVAHRVLK